MSQPPFRSKPSNSSTTPPRRLQTPQERFGLPEPAPDSDPVLDGEGAPEGHTAESDDPFAPYVRPKLQTQPKVQGRQHAPRRHELKTHQVRPHQLKRHEVKRLERERHEPVGHAAPGPTLANGVPAEATPKRIGASKFWKRLFGTAFVLFVGCCTVAAFSAPQFEVKTVRLEGVHDTPGAQVAILARSLIGQNFFRANRAKVERAVEAFPTVASARIVRQAGWPPRLTLVVKERHPLLRVGGGENWWVVDDSGMPFRKAEAQDDDLYALTAPQFEPQTGKPLPAPAWSQAVELEKALSLDNALVDGDAQAKAQSKQTEGTASGGAPFWQLRRLYFDRHGMASIRVSGQGALRAHKEMLIRLGESDWAPKLARARVALSYFERTGRNAQELDLVSYTYPTWRAKAEEAQNQDGHRVGLADSGFASGAAHG